MNDKFREWYLTVNIAPKEGQMQKRISAIETFCKKITKNNALNLLKLYYNIEVDENFKSELIGCMVAQDETFLSKNEEELKLLAGSSLVQLAENNRGVDSIVELFSMAINVGRSPAIIPEIYDVIVENYNIDSANLRKLNEPTSVITQLPIKAFKDHINVEGFTTLEKAGLDKLISVLEVIQKNQTNLSDRLTKNEVLTSIYREDSQVLWWLMCEQSKELDLKLKTLDKTNACIVIGKEAASFITNYPGPTAIKGILNKMIGHCKGKSEAISLDRVIEQIPTEWKSKFIEDINKEENIIDLLPLHSAILRSKNTENTTEWYPKFNREVLTSTENLKLSPQEFAWQMYIECLAFKCYLELEH